MHRDSCNEGNKSFSLLPKRLETKHMEHLYLRHRIFIKFAEFFFNLVNSLFLSKNPYKYLSQSKEFLPVHIQQYTHASFCFEILNQWINYKYDSPYLQDWIQKKYYYYSEILCYYRSVDISILFHFSE